MNAYGEHGSIETLPSLTPLTNRAECLEGVIGVAGNVALLEADESARTELGQNRALASGHGRQLRLEPADVGAAKGLAQALGHTRNQHQCKGLGEGGRERRGWRKEISAEGGGGL